MNMPKAKQKAPSFTLADQDGKTHSLKGFVGSWVVLYFYPKDNTPGCTVEACSFRDGYAALRRASVVILGVSTDSVKSHQKFAEKFSLPFLLLADTDKQVVAKYGVWQKKKFMGREYFGIVRTTFLIDPAGKIAQVYENVKPGKHAETILADVKKLKQNT